MRKIRSLLVGCNLWPSSRYAGDLSELLAADPRFKLEYAGDGWRALLQGAAAAEETRLQLRAVCDAAVEELQATVAVHRWALKCHVIPLHASA